MRVYTGVYSLTAAEGEDVARVSNRIVYEGGQPQTIKTGNGSEFISKVMDKWAYERGVELDFSWPGNPRSTLNRRQPAPERQRFTARARDMTELRS